MMKFGLIAISFSICLGLNAQLSPEKYIALARNDFEKENYTLAIQRLNFAIKSAPYNVEAFFLRAMAKYNLEDYDGAIVDYSSCLRFAPDNPGVYQNRGLCFAQKGDHYAAIDDFERGLKYDPGNYLLYINKAYSELNLKLYEDVVKTSDLAIQINPYLETGYMLRGAAQMELKNPEKAIENFNKAIEIDSGNSEAYLRRAMSYNDNLEYSKALEDCDRAIALDTASSLGYFVKANIYADRFEYKKALENYDKVIAISPNNAMAHYNRANVYTRLNRYKDAAYDYKRVTEINPENILGHFNLALSYHKLNQYKMALKSYDKVIELYPNMADAWFNRAFIKRELGDDKGAAMDFYKGNEIRGKNKLKTYDPEEENLLAKRTQMDADFYRPNFSEEEQKIAIYTIPYFEVKQFDYKNVSKKHLKYNINTLTEFNEEYNNLPFYYVSNPILGEQNWTPEEAEVLLESLKKTSASTPHYWLNKATLYKAQYDFNAALEIYDTLISKYPDFALGYFNKASTMYDLLEMLLRMNNMQGTVSQAGMAKNPQSPALKDVETTNLQLKEVENLLIRSVQIDPDFYYAWFNLALIKTEQKEYEPALDCYTKAIKVNNDFVEAYYNRGLTYLYLENTRKACQDLSKAGELGLNDAYEVIKIYCK